jgi:hypothetical protein
MLRWRRVSGLLASSLLLLSATVGRADRVPSQKAYLPHSPGARGDITVPYLTNGSSTLGAYNLVGPRITSSPRVDDPQHPGEARPVYNLIFYGSRMGFGDASQGATERPGQFLRPDGK